MKFRSHEVEPQYQATFPTFVIDGHSGFTSSGNGIEKSLSPKKPIIPSKVEETDGSTTDTQ